MGNALSFQCFCRFNISIWQFPGTSIIWLIKKEEMPFVEDQGKEVLNFQISMTIYLLISGILCIILIGIPIIIGLVIFCFIITIIAAISANDGKSYRYPINLRLIK